MSTSSQGVRPPATPTRAAFAFIFVTVALDMLALGVIIPVLPKLIVQFEGGNIAKGAAISGVFGTVWAAMQFLFSPVLGSLSDRHGRRPVILASNMGLGLDYIVMAVAPSLGWLFVGRLLSGVTSASVPTAAAYLSDVTPPEKRASRFGMLGAAFGLGFIIGPAVGGLLGAIDLRLPFWAAGGLSVLNALYGFFILPESLPKDHRAPFDARRASPLGSLELLRSHPELLGLSVTAFLSYLAHESLPAVYVLYTDFRYQWDQRAVGISLAGIGIASVIVQGGLVRHAVSWLGERRALLAGLLFGVVGFGLYGIAPSGSLFLSGIPFVALWGLAGASMQALMTRRVGPSEHGRLQGALASVRGMTGMIGPLLFTQVFSRTIARDAALTHPGAAYLLAAFLLLLAIVLAARVTREEPPKGRGQG